MIGRPVLTCALLVAALALGARAPVGAQPVPVDVTLAMNAPGSGNWPVYIALDRGFFRDAGLHVTPLMSGSNTNTINAVATGGAQLGLDGSDIDLAAVGRKLPIKIIAPEFGPNPYTVLAGASVASWADLKGKTVVLGTPQDVSSLTFARLAADHNLRRDDFTIVTSPSSSSRYAALLSGNAQATVLSQPFDILAETNGYHALATASESVRPWADTSFIVNTSWAAAAGHHALVVQFVRALRRAVRFGYANPESAVASLVQATNVTPEVARKAYDADFRTKRVFDLNDNADFASGLRAMAAALQSAGATAVPDVADALDGSYLKESAP